MEVSSSLADWLENLFSVSEATAGVVQTRLAAFASSHSLVSTLNDNRQERFVNE